MSGMGSRLPGRDEVNVKVLLRCRPANAEELALRTPQVVTCNEPRKEVVVSQSIAGKFLDKTYTFDRVFGPTATQADVFSSAVVPIIEEVLEGFNCTIFAYGQTGTGKTYTMEGGPFLCNNGKNIAETAGVIPRAVERIFQILEGNDADCSVKVSFLELYNEELTDLLDVHDSKSQKLKIMEAKNQVVVQGLDEQLVENAEEIFEILERGSSKRQTAETLLNVRSSRSHSIFSITIHIREISDTGEDVIKTGKLNLVDLAGSENVSRSGAKDGRAREAGSINQSLLTLGRVINTLVERASHVPYRDSKLTRLLRDSLGGRTKTCIIATIAPTVHCDEETFSTLEYAYRAKNIRNRPEVNQKISKGSMIRDLNAEVKKLTEELMIQRKKDGVYLEREKYEEWEKERLLQGHRVKNQDEELETRQKEIADLQKKVGDQEVNITDLQGKLDLERFVCAAYKAAESALASHSTTLTTEIGKFAQHIEVASNLIARSNHREEVNKRVADLLVQALKERIQVLKDCMKSFTETSCKNLEALKTGLGEFESRRAGEVERMVQKGQQVSGHAGDVVRVFEEGMSQLQELNQQAVSEILGTASQCLKEAQNQAAMCEKRVTDIDSSLTNTIRDLEGNLKALFDAQKTVSEAVKKSNKKAQHFLCGAKRGAAEIESFSSDCEKAHTAGFKVFQSNMQQEQEKLQEMLYNAVKESMSAQMEQAMSWMSGILENNAQCVQMAQGVKEGIGSAMDQLTQQDAAVGSNDKIVEKNESEMAETINRVRNLNVAMQSDSQIAPQNMMALFQNHCAKVEALIAGAVSGCTTAAKKARTEGETSQKLLTDANEVSMNELRKGLELDKAFAGEMGRLAGELTECQRECQTAHTTHNEDLQKHVDKSVGELLWDDKAITCPVVSIDDLPDRDVVEQIRAPEFEALVEQFKQDIQEVKTVKSEEHDAPMEDVLKPRSVQNMANSKAPSAPKEGEGSGGEVGPGHLPSSVTRTRGSVSRIPKAERPQNSAGFGWFSARRSARKKARRRQDQ